MLLAFVFVTSIFHGQDVKMTSEYSSNNLEISDILEFGNIDFNDVNFVRKNITDKSITLVCKEMWDGKHIFKDNNPDIGLIKRLDKFRSDSKF